MNPSAGARASILSRAPWLRRPRLSGSGTAAVAGSIRNERLHSVCEEARCPNRHECWHEGTATFMVLGNACTRRCLFCSVATGRPGSPDPGEPARLARVVEGLELGHVVVTSVARDDLADQGAGHFAACVRSILERVPSADVEVLTPDFRGDERLIRTVLDSGPAVFNHNLETVERISPRIRPRAGYRRSLSVLETARRLAPAVFVKSGLMVGLGETDDELDAAMEDLASAGCQILTVGQYLQPSFSESVVDRYVPPEAFARIHQRSARLGFLHVTATPFTRSSHKAGEALAAARALARGRR